jgi:hypothetical protein
MSLDVRPMSTRFQVRVRRPVDFIRAGLNHFPHDCYLSLEGDLSRFDSTLIPGTSHMPTTLLRKYTISPVQDFVILPVTAATSDLVSLRVLSQVGLKHHIIHIQIASESRLVLGAYDNFHRECVWIDAAIGQEGITSMLDSGIIGWYQLRQHEERSA